MDSDEEIEVNLNVAEVSAIKFESRFAYTSSANKWVREELERLVDEEEEDELDEREEIDGAKSTSYPTVRRSCTGEAQLERASVTSLSSPAASLSMGFRRDGGSSAAPQSHMEVLPGEASDLGLRALPLGDEAYIINVGEITASVLKLVRLPAPRRYVRTSFDQNLAGLDHKPWHNPGAVQSEYFNYGLDEATFSHYARRQRELRIALSRFTLMPAEDGSNSTVANGRLDLDAIDQYVQSASSTHGGAFGLVDDVLTEDQPGESGALRPLAKPLSLDTAGALSHTPIATGGASKIRVGAMLAMAARFAADMNRANQGTTTAQSSALTTGRASANCRRYRKEGRRKGDDDGDQPRRGVSVAELTLSFSAAFHAADTYEGNHPGWFFGSGTFGLGYYRDYYPECLQSLVAIANASAKAIEAETGSNSSSSSSNDGGGGGGDVMANSNGAPRKRKHLVESVVRGASLAVQYDEAGNRQVDGSNTFHGTSSKQEHGGATATQTRLSPLPVASAEVFDEYAQTSSKERSVCGPSKPAPPSLDPGRFPGNSGGTDTKKLPPPGPPPRGPPPQGLTSAAHTRHGGQSIVALNEGGGGGERGGQFGVLGCVGGSTGERGRVSGGRRDRRGESGSRGDELRRGQRDWIWERDRDRDRDRGRLFDERKNPENGQQPSVASGGMRARSKKPERDETEGGSVKDDDAAHGNDGRALKRHRSKSDGAAAVVVIEGIEGVEFDTEEEHRMPGTEISSSGGDGGGDQSGGKHRKQDKNRPTRDAGPSELRQPPGSLRHSRGGKPGGEKSRSAQSKKYSRGGGSTRTLSPASLSRSDQGFRGGGGSDRDRGRPPRGSVRGDRRGGELRSRSPDRHIARSHRQRRINSNRGK